ncbi:MAG: response regulator [Candidatus Riflebacteria bacterium]|nr:response regulator [Candidatus Riflebacteria bacterium]
MSVAPSPEVTLTRSREHASSYSRSVRAEKESPRWHPFELWSSGLTGIEALRLVNRLQPDVVFLDINMPVLDGLEAAARIGASFPQVRIAILTSQPVCKDIVDRCTAAGVRRFLDKLSTKASDLPQAIRELHRLGGDDGGSRVAGFASVWSFLGSKASAGSTTLAVNVALELAGLGNRTLLIDFDFTQGDLLMHFHGDFLSYRRKPFLKLLSKLADHPESSHEILERGLLTFSPPPEFMKERGLEGALNLDILPFLGPAVDVMSGLLGNPEATTPLQSVLETATGRYQYIVLDLTPGTFLLPHTATALEHSELLFMLSNSDRASIWALEKICKMVQAAKFPQDKTLLLLSQVIRDKSFDPRAWVASRQLHLGDLLPVPVSPSAVARAIKSGLPCLLEREPDELALFVEQLVRRALRGKPELCQPQRGFWGRLQTAVRVLVGDGSEAQIP